MQRVSIIFIMLHERCLISDFFVVAEQLNAEQLNAAREDIDKAQEDDENSTFYSQNLKLTLSKYLTVSVIAMEIDSASKPSKSRLNKHRINKRKQKKSGIIFPKYGDLVAAKKKKLGGK